jgi:hypothetical protein
MTPGGGGGGRGGGEGREGGGGPSHVVARACLAGVFHGIGIHAKLYPVIYTVSFMANFSHQERHRQELKEGGEEERRRRRRRRRHDGGWAYVSPNSVHLVDGCCFRCDDDDDDGDDDEPELEGPGGGGMGGGGATTEFPWRHPARIADLAAAWVRRLFFTPSSM